MNYLALRSTITDVQPLFHPAIEDLTVEALLHALADPVRIALLAGIVDQQCSRSCSALGTVADHPIPKSTLSQHFRILREAGLIRGERRGVEMHNTSRCAEVDQRFPGLIAGIAQAYKIQAAHQARAQRNATRRANPAPSAKPRRPS